MAGTVPAGAGHPGEADAAALIVVTGPPGAGKSTVARRLSRRFEPSALVAGDDVFGFIDRGFVPPWTSGADRQNEIVIEAGAAAAGRLATGGYTVVFDGVVGPWFLEAFLAASGLAGIHYVMLLPPEEVCVDRVRTRIGHAFADLDATRHMHREFAGAEIDRRHVLASTESAGAVAATIAELVQGGSLRWTQGGAAPGAR